MKFYAEKREFSTTSVAEGKKSEFHLFSVFEFNSSSPVQVCIRFIILFFFILIKKQLSYLLAYIVLLYFLGNRIQAAKMSPLDTTFGSPLVQLVTLKMWIPTGAIVEEEHIREEEAKDGRAIVPMLCYLFLCSCSQIICHFSNNSASSSNFLFFLFSVRYLKNRIRRSLAREKMLFFG